MTTQSDLIDLCRYCWLNPADEQGWMCLADALLEFKGENEYRIALDALNCAQHKVWSVFWGLSPTPGAGGGPLPCYGPSALTHALGFGDARPHHYNLVQWALFPERMPKKPKKRVRKKR